MMRRLAFRGELGEERSHQLVWIITSTSGSQVEDTGCLWSLMDEKQSGGTGVTGVARSLHASSVDECRGCGLLDVFSKP